MRGAGETPYEVCVREIGEHGRHDRGRYGEDLGARPGEPVRDDAPGVRSTGPRLESFAASALND